MSDTDTFDYAMPSLGADMDEGRVIEWRIAPGDTVHRGDLIAVVETEKSDIDIEIWHDGIVEEFLVDVGQLVDVGTPIARLRAVGAGAETAPVTARPHESGPAAPASAPASLRQPAPAPASTPDDRVPASPLARRLAAEQGIDLHAVSGSGPGGAVTEADVVASASAQAGGGAEAPEAVPAAPPAGPRRSADTMRSLIAERMTTANREIPHYYLSRDLDVGALEGWLAERNESRPIAERILPAACFIRAVALAAARHRELNGFWIGDRFEPAESVNVAMAISLRRGGLVTPHIERADERSLDEVMAALGELVTAARTGNLRASWMTGATITITHLGDSGADLVHGVISPPQVALVGFGRSRDRAWVVDGEVVVRPVVTTTLAADHRATDGAVGSRFVATLAQHIDHPEDLL
ncbi:MAG TPA: dihydrolipoamide acetyltransferase family protein [Ilumatobacteraceae bacterium]|nr:dihydrolipoamide acetyltransferase family protein [Ilumatobacteraceae bacterium]